MPMDRPPLLSFDDVRIDADGVTLLERLSFETRATTVGLVGDFSAVFRTLGGKAAIVAGRALLAGREPRRAVVERVVGVALHGASAPPRWTALQYLETGARLRGAGKLEARRAARETLHGLGLFDLADRRFEQLATAERRALFIAQAALGSPEVLMLENPLSELDELGQGFVHQLLLRAAAGRGLLVSLPATPPFGAEHALLHGLEEVIVLAGGTLVAQGSPEAALSPARRFVVTVGRRGEELAERLSASGFSVAETMERGAFRLLVELPDGADSGVIIEAALGVEAPIFELLPLSTLARPR
jgi:ABC-type multidrug transport system ATPase subunit